MRVAIFLCNEKTMGECFEKRLFGTGEAYGRQVRKGDLLFLYNYSDKHLWGIWLAEADGGLFDSKAWGGRYRNQVRISQVSKVLMRFPRYCFNKILGQGENIGQILAGYKAQNLMQYFAHEYSLEKDLGITLSGIEEDYRNRYPVKFLCEDGHRVRSTHEKIIDDWFYRHRVPHAYEPILLCLVSLFLILRFTALMGSQCMLSIGVSSMILFIGKEGNTRASCTLITDCP